MRPRHSNRSFPASFSAGGFKRTAATAANANGAASGSIYLKTRYTPAATPMIRSILFSFSFIIRSDPSTPPALGRHIPAILRQAILFLDYERISQYLFCPYFCAAIHRHGYSLFRLSECLKTSHFISQIPKAHTTAADFRPLAPFPHRSCPGQGAPTQNHRVSCTPCHLRRFSRRSSDPSRLLSRPSPSIPG